MGSGKWEVRSEKWEVGSGKWEVGDGEFRISVAGAGVCWGSKLFGKYSLAGLGG